MDINTLIGVIGILTVLWAFMMNLFHKWGPKDKNYLLFNVLGCILLAYYAYILESLPFLVLQLVWGLVSLYKFFIVLK